MDRKTARALLISTREEVTKKLGSTLSHMRRTKLEAIIEARFGHLDQPTLVDIVNDLVTWVFAERNRQQFSELFDIDASKEDLLTLLTNTFRLGLAPTYEGLE